jgi:hypothetical protein
MDEGVSSILRRPIGAAILYQFVPGTRHEMKRLIKKKICKIGLFIAGNTLICFPCWNCSSRLVDLLIVGSEAD